MMTVAMVAGAAAVANAETFFQFQWTDQQGVRWEFIGVINDDGSGSGTIGNSNGQQANVIWNTQGSLQGTNQNSIVILAQNPRIQSQFYAWWVLQ